MPELSDFLGHILEEVTRARVQSDVAALEVAKSYVDDATGIMKYFPVPRFRLPNLEITAPVIISNVPDGFTQKADPSLLSQSIVRDLQSLLVGHKINISTSAIIALIKSDPDLSRGYVSSSAAETLSAKIGEEVMASTSAPITPNPKDSSQKSTKQSKSVAAPGNTRNAAEVAHGLGVDLIREQIVKTIGALPMSVQGISIDATTANVKAYNPVAGQGANLMYLKMFITEDALEIELQPTEPVKQGEPTPAPLIKRLSPE
jgi:hypothetical protein